MLVSDSNKWNRKGYRLIATAGSLLAEIPVSPMRDSFARFNVDVESLLWPIHNGKPH